MASLADPHPVHVHPDADLPEITGAMSDYNLLVLPVLDHDDHLIGVLTIDDILEATIPPEWRRRRE
jgi:Mg/Co/Ni transporter MgtE